MRKIFKKILGHHSWKREWQEQLALSLQEAQRSLTVNMVVAIAEESDFYAEILFILSFIGLGIGSLAAYLFQSKIQASTDLILFPLGGFALGSSLFQFRRFFLLRFAPRAVRERVSQRAKSLFFDHSQNLKKRVVLLYFSELEREVLFVTSPELLDAVPASELQIILSSLIEKYKSKDPLASLRPCLLDLGHALGRHLGTSDSYDLEKDASVPIYLGASDSPSRRLKFPILKGSKDIN